jgi:hypothetical protein
VPHEVDAGLGCRFAWDFDASKTWAHRATKVKPRETQGAAGTIRPYRGWTARRPWNQRLEPVLACLRNHVEAIPELHDISIAHRRSSLGGQVHDIVAETSASSDDRQAALFGERFHRAL